MSEQPTGKKIGLSKKRPQSEATPLGVPAAEIRKGRARKAKRTNVESEATEQAETATSAEDVVSAVASDMPSAENETPEQQIVEDTQETACVESTNVVEFPKQFDTVPTTKNEVMKMATVTFALDNSKPRKTNAAVYKVQGVRGSVRFAPTMFAGGEPPTQISAEVPDGIFAEPKQAMTPEQRKEARKNAPKPTIEDKLAAAERRLAKLREKAARAAAAQTAQSADTLESVNA